ncbi:MAG: hypothetical protein KDE08_02355 [Rhodobacteraceae bacterium]|nr:hypothetical protein [Paracoccaceae bacterium]
MNITIPADGPLTTVDLEAADFLFVDIARELMAATAKIRAGEFDDLKDVTRTLRDMRLAIQMGLEERAKVAKLQKQHAGVVYDFALDLDAARLEIGGRLARLRDAGNC